MYKTLPFNAYNYNHMLQQFKDVMWRIGIYARLSKEDEKKYNDKKDSESIQNQINFLKAWAKDFAITCGIKCIIYDIYIDDGYTGCNFNRPNFNRLINDVEAKNVNLVLTKDLSRLGRDYIETGYYVEKYFPIKNVRYVAVGDNIDTFDETNANNDMTPFKSVMNDMYAKDISKKVRTAMLTKMINGESVKAHVEYGFKKDPNNKNNIIIDEEVMHIVIKIFDLFYSGWSKSQICRYLDETGIETPMAHKEKTTNYRNPHDRCTYRWSVASLTEILKNKSYIGLFVQNKTKKINYKVNKTVYLNEEFNIVTKKKEIAYIDEDVFKVVSEKLKNKSNNWNYTANAVPHLLRGLVFCSCGAKVGFNKNHGKHFRCICMSYKRTGGKYHSNIHILEDELIKELVTRLRKKLQDVLNTKDINYKPSKIITDNLKHIKKKLEETVCSTPEIEEAVKELMELKDDKEVNRSIIEKFIERIVLDDREIDIKYKFRKE